MVKGLKMVRAVPAATSETRCAGTVLLSQRLRALVGSQRFLDGPDKEVDPQRQQDDHADGLQDSLEIWVGRVGEEIVTAEEDQGEEDQVAGNGADCAGEGAAPTADHAAADGQHVDRAHRRGRRQPHEKCGREYVDVGDEHHVATDR